MAQCQRREIATIHYNLDCRCWIYTSSWSQPPRFVNKWSRITRINCCSTMLIGKLHVYLPCCISVWNTPNSGNAAWHVFGLFLCTCIQNNNLGFLFIILYWWFGFLIFQQRSSSSYDAWELTGLVIGSLRDNCCSPSWVFVGSKCIMVKVCKGLYKCEMVSGIASCWRSVFTSGSMYVWSKLQPNSQQNAARTVPLTWRLSSASGHHLWVFPLEI